MIAVKPLNRTVLADLSLFAKKSTTSGAKVSELCGLSLLPLLIKHKKKKSLVSIFYMKVITRLYIFKKRR